MVKNTKPRKRSPKKKVSRTISINCETEAEVLLPFFTNVVHMLNEQVEESKAPKPRRKVVRKRVKPQKPRQQQQEQEQGQKVITSRVSRNNGGIQKRIRKQSLALYPMRRSLLPFFNIAASVKRVQKLPSEVNSLVELPVISSLDSISSSDSSVPLPISTAPIPNEAPSGDIFNIVRDNINIICNGEFAPQDVSSQNTQIDQQNTDPFDSSIDIYECLNDRMQKE